MDTIPTHPSVPVEPRRKSRVWLWIVATILVVTAGVSVFGFIKRIPAPDTERRPETKTESVPSETEGYVSAVNNYTLSVPEEWQIFEEEHHPERAEMSASELKDVIATCGISCAAIRTVKLGNYPGTQCVSDTCDSLEQTEGTSLIIYTFSNTENLTLKDFLARVFLKNVDMEHFSRFETVNGLDVQSEVLRFEDGRQLRNYYFARDNMIYWLDEDISTSGLQEHNELLNALDEIVSSLTFQ